MYKFETEIPSDFLFYFSLLWKKKNARWSWACNGWLQYIMFVFVIYFIWTWCAFHRIIEMAYGEQMVYFETKKKKSIVLFWDLL